MSNTIRKPSKIEQNDPTRSLFSPLDIRGREIRNRLLLAPMAGLGHVALRGLIGEFGGYGLLFTGMCSAKAVPTENPDFSTVFTWQKEELPRLVCQLFGSEPITMAKAAVRVEREGFFGVDLNFGCCAAAICKQGSGAALLKHPDRARAIVATVREAVEIPLFVKFRTGWENDLAQTIQMAQWFEDAGADALIFHPRVAPDRRARPPKWAHIRHVKGAVTIPVFGNGNVFSPEDCQCILEESRCDGISIGRMAVAKPWIFAEMAHALHCASTSSREQRDQDDSHGKNEGQHLKNDSAWPSFIPRDRVEMREAPNIYHYAASRLIQRLTSHYDAATTVRMWKKIAPYVAANFKFGHSILKGLLKGDHPDEIIKQIDRVLGSLPETTLRPNLHLFS